MKYCCHCHINIENPRDYCPLCQNLLSKGDGTEKETFPIIPTVMQEHVFLLRLLGLLSILAIIVTTFINFIHHQHGWWSIIVISSVAYFWLVVFSFVRTRNRLASIPKSVVVIALLLFLVDYAYGFYRWSINYAIPALLFAAIASVLIISIMRGLRFADFLIYLILTGVFALLPFIFIITNLTTVKWPSLACMFSGIAAFLSVIVFADQEVRSELKRRFHL